MGGIFFGLVAAGAVVAVMKNSNANEAVTRRNQALEREQIDYWDGKARSAYRWRNGFALQAGFSWLAGVIHASGWRP
jgi:hypothetical protein